MKYECLLKRTCLFLACALFAAVLSPARAQDSRVRVGPDADDSASGKASKTAGRSAGNKSDEKDDTAKKKGAEQNAGKQDSAKRTGDATAESSVVSANVPTAASADPAAQPHTSDAPAKRGEQALPSIAPKGTLTVEKTPTGTPVGNGTPASKDATTAPQPAPSNTNSWNPPAEPPPTAVYRVGVGDVLDIRLFNQPARESTLYTVMGGGLIEYPLAGEPINVAGMTTEEIGVRIASELRRRAVYDKIPQVFVSVREYASHAVLVSGLVNDPGVKVLRREAIPLYVIIAEAQPKPDAGRALVMSHSTGQTHSVDLSDAQALNMLVRPSDVVTVVARPQEFFYIGGEVALPGQRDYHASMTLTQAVLASGGATRFASGSVRVSRQGADGRLSSTQYNLNLILEGKVADPVIRAGDRIEVERKK